jgi:uncharacterized protein YecT (DUF1311 family)
MSFLRRFSDKYAVKVVFFAAASLFMSCATSQDMNSVLMQLYGLRASYFECLNKAETALAPSMSCMRTELSYQEGRLNAAYKKLMAKLDVANQTKLRSDERIWIQYRDARCADRIYGIDQPRLSGLSCTVDEAGKRASDLEAWLFQQ